jgi:hypothetical protein
MSMINFPFITSLVCICYTGMGACIPIADIRDTDTADYDKGEKLFRCKLASLYRLIDLFGWSHGIDSYITVSLQNYLCTFLDGVHPVFYLVWFGESLL